MLSLPGNIEVVLPSSVAGLLNPGDRNSGALKEKKKDMNEFILSSIHPVNAIEFEHSILIRE